MTPDQISKLPPEPHFGRLIDATRLCLMLPMLQGIPLAFRPNWKMGEYARVGDGPVIDGALVREWARAEYLRTTGHDEDWEILRLTDKGRTWVLAAQQFANQERKTR